MTRLVPGKKCVRHSVRKLRGCTSNVACRGACMTFLAYFRCFHVNTEGRDPLGVRFVPRCESFGPRTYVRMRGCSSLISRQRRPTFQFCLSDDDDARRDARCLSRWSRCSAGEPRQSWRVSPCSSSPAARPGAAAGTGAVTSPLRLGLRAGDPSPPPPDSDLLGPMPWPPDWNLLLSAVLLPSVPRHPFKF